MFRCLRITFHFLLLLPTRPANAAPSEAVQAPIEGVVQAMRLQDEDYDGRRDSRTTHNGDASISGRPEPDPQQQVWIYIEQCSHL